MKSTPPTPDGLPVLGHTHEYVRDAFDFIDRAAEAEGTRSRSGSSGRAR
ncbi:hypothetical protein VB773_12305 [Haloarculaceae archaeon H-GB2-1]|nr:hypothetical protein [Haloarculaceae archaeon H-GB2-1]